MRTSFNSGYYNWNSCDADVYVGIERSSALAGTVHAEQPVKPFWRIADQLRPGAGSKRIDAGLVSLSPKTLMTLDPHGVPLSQYSTVQMQ